MKALNVAALLCLPWVGTILAQAPASSATAPAATPVAPPSAAPQMSSAELEKLAMPIALHPDPLISIILPASAYPLEIVQAARFVKDTNNIPKVDDQPWDENVRAVAKFPELIAKLDADLPWTMALGKAFIEQPKELMDTIQSLRAKAHKAGTLQTSTQQIVIVTNVVVVQTNLTQVVNVTNQVVQVQPASPQVVYVPSYPPTVYYPPPAYVYDPYAPLVTFGVGIAVGAIIANNCDWHHGGIYVGHNGFVAWGGGSHGDVDIDIDNSVNIDRGSRPTPQSGNRSANTSAKPTQQKWQPDQTRLNTSGAPATAQTREARGWGGGATQPAVRPSTGAANTRPAQSPAYSAAQRPTTGTPAVRQAAVNRPAPAAPSASQRPVAAQQTSFNRPASQNSTAFGGVSSGSSARSAGYRGAASRGGGGMRGGGGRGR